MKIATKVGLVLATVGMAIGLLGAPAEARDSSWDSRQSARDSSWDIP